MFDSRVVSKSKIQAGVLCAALAAPSLASAQERIYLANDDHTDYFWTSTDVGYRNAFLTMLDYYIAQVERTAGNPSDFRGRFNCDNALWAWEYERNRTPAQFERFMSHVRSGSITLAMQSLVPLYGAMPTEAVLRDLYYAGRLERRHNVDLRVVQSMENATIPGGIASLWAGAGAEFSWRGVCGCASQTDVYSPRGREIYRFRGPDGRGVVMKWNTLYGDASIGGYGEARNPDGAINYMTSDPGFRARWPWPVMGAFGYGHDELSTTTEVFITTAMARSTPTRRVIVSNITDFFTDFMGAHGADVPNFTGSFGNEWELLTASLADVSARMKRAVEKLRTAEALATVVALRDPTVLDGREAARDEAFLRMGMYYDHDWTADTPLGRTPRLNFQRDSVARVESYVDGLHEAALSRLAASIPAVATAAQSFVVFNPLGWQRADVVDLPAAPTGAFHVVDAFTGSTLPSQVVGSGADTRVRVLVRDVPGIGYRVLELRTGAGETFPAAATVTGATVDTARYRVTVATDGAITSLVDHRAADRELVRAGSALNRMNGATAGAVTLESSGPVSATLRVAAGGAPAHTTRVTVYAGLDRVDVEDRITQNFGNAVGYQFDLGLTGFAVRHEEVGMVARAARIRDGGDYANQNTRTDHLTFNHFVDLSESGFGVTISNGDSGFFRLGASTQDVLDTSQASLFAVVGMQSEGADLGFPNQGGDASFLNRYALATHGAYDAASAMRTALEHQNPLVARAVTGGPTAPMPLRYGLLHADDPDVVVWAVKPAEEGIDRGVIVRAWNFADRARPVAINPHGGSTLSSAMRTTHIEGDLTPATVRDGCLFDTLERQQMQTWRLMLTGVNTTGNVLTPGLDAGVGDAGGGMALQRAPSAESTGCAARPRGARQGWVGWSVAALLLAFRAAGRRRRV